MNVRVCLLRVMTSVGACVCVHGCERMKPRFVFAHVPLMGVKTPVCVRRAGAVCILPEPAVCSALSREHTCVFVSCACPSVPACAVGAGGPGIWGPG